MGAKKYGHRANEFKYGMPLYGCAFPAGKHFFVCGGGGHGLVPRLLWAKYEAGKCTDQVGDYKLGNRTPMRMALAPSGSALLLGNSEGGIRRFQLDTRGETPRVIEVTAAFHSRLQDLQDEVTAMAFSADGRRLAIGFEWSIPTPTATEPNLQETRYDLRLVDYPSMRMQQRIEMTSGVKDVTFWVRDEQPRIMAVTCDNGTCNLYDADAGAKLCQLQPPKGMERAKFTKVRFARDGSNTLFAGINLGRDASYLAAYVLDDAQDQSTWRLAKKVKVDDGPNSCLEVSKSGAMVGMGQTNGRLMVFNAANLHMIKQEKEANQVFISAITFSDDELRLVAVGGDANCFVLDLEQPKPRQMGVGSVLAVMSIIMVLLSAMVAVLNDPQLLAPLGDPAVQAATAASAWVHAHLATATPAAVSLLDTLTSHPVGQACKAAALTASNFTTAAASSALQYIKDEL